MDTSLRDFATVGAQLRHSDPRIPSTIEVKVKDVNPHRKPTVGAIPLGRSTVPHNRNRHSLRFLLQPSHSARLNKNRFAQL
jgi:hypothetical protein